MKATWTKEWPIEEGEYWFYGLPYGNSLNPKICIEKPRLFLVKIRKCSNGILFMTEGTFIQPAKMKGVWAKVDLPELPNLES
jgi:hypothetical protein